MKPQTKRDRLYDRLTHLTLLREMSDELRMEGMEESVLPEDQADLEPDVLEVWEQFNDIHGLLALIPSTITNLE